MKRQPSTYMHGHILNAITCRRLFAFLSAVVAPPSRTVATHHAANCRNALAGWIAAAAVRGTQVSCTNKQTSAKVATCIDRFNMSESATEEYLRIGFLQVVSVFATPWISSMRSTRSQLNARAILPGPCPGQPMRKYVLPVHTRSTVPRLTILPLARSIVYRVLMPAWLLGLACALDALPVTTTTSHCLS